MRNKLPFFVLDVSFFSEARMLLHLSDVPHEVILFDSPYTLTEGTYHQPGHFTAAIRVAQPVVNTAGWYFYDGLTAHLSLLS